MRKFNEWSEVEVYTKYRIDILDGEHKGIYLYNDKKDEADWLLNVASQFNEGTKIFFLERIGEIFNVYEITGMIKRRKEE